MVTCITSPPHPAVLARPFTGLKEGCVKRQCEVRMHGPGDPRGLSLTLQGLGSGSCLRNMFYDILFMYIYFSV